MEEINEKKKRIIKDLYKIISVILAFVTSAGLWYWNVSPQWGEGYFGYLPLLVVGIAFCMVYWFFAKMYQALKIGIYRLTELTYFQVLSFGIADVILFIASLFWFHGFKGIELLSYAVVFVLQIVITVGVIFVLNRFFAKYDSPRKVVIVYGREDYIDFLKKIKAKAFRYEVKGCFDEGAPMEIIKEAIGECASVYLYDVDREIKKELILYCNSMGKDIYLTQDVEDLITMGFDVSHTFDTPFIRTKRVPVKWYYPFIKRTLDIICSGLALVVLSPVLLIVAIAIKSYDKGPVFYKQVRLTKGHKEFEIYKFRSMITDAEKGGARLASQNDSRITPVGKIIRATRIDELPQLINILKGDMTIVGPRPERPEIEKQYLKELPEFGLRLQVKAGLTGYAQVFGKYNTTPLDKLKLDLLYINQRCLLLDLKLILYTVKIIFIPESTEGITQGSTTALKKKKSLDHPKKDAENKNDIAI